MPQPAKRPRLWLRPRRDDAKATWIILDRGKHIATGCAEGETERADEALAAYIAAKYAPRRKQRDIEDIAIADVLAIYVADKGTAQADVARFARRIGRLNDFWGARMLADVSGETCRDYAGGRSRATARRDLEDLRAAINHHAKEGFHRGTVAVTLPAKGQPRDRWLTRGEAARLLWACWRHREVQTRHRGADAGKALATRKRPLRHLARFILIGLYTGTRSGAIASASPMRAEGRSFVDLDRGIFYRLAIGRRETNKRQPPAPIPPRLLAHLRRWHRLGIAKEHFVEFAGMPVRSVKTAFATALDLAGIGHASPHTLRHTAATWMMQNGAPLWQAAGFLGMSEKTLRDVYGHQHPDHMADAVKAIENRPRSQEPLVVLLAEARRRAGK